MNEKASTAQQKALQERKRGHFDKAVKRLEQAIAQFPDELDLYLDAVDACLEGGEVSQATNFLKTAQDKFVKDKERVAQFVREKLLSVHDPSLARFVVENAVKRRDLSGALEHLEQIPDHVARDLLARTKTKKQSLKSASHGGYSLGSETLTNDLLAAVLSIRLDNMKEGLAALVEIVDARPAELKMIAPFLSELEAKFPRGGRVRFANGCALWAGGNEVDAIARFVEAARFDSTAIATCVERLYSVREKTKFPAKVERALAEVLLLKSDFDEAATVLRTYLAEHKDSAREVIMLLKPFIDPAHSVNECVWVALDAALSLDQSQAAMEILRPMHQSGKRTPDIYKRLEDRSKHGAFTTEVMLFHASLGLELKDYARAAEILNAVIAAQPNDVHAVLGLAEKHRTAHADLEELCRKHAPPETVETLSEEEGDFQNFDHNEFSLNRAPNAPSAPRPSAPRAPDERPASRFAEERKKPVEKTSFVETRELSFDDDGTPESPAGDSPIDHPGDEIDDSVFEISQDLRLSSPRAETPSASPKTAPPAQTPPPAPKSRPTVNLRTETARTEPAPVADGPTITESHVNNVAQRLRDAGASAFFHIDGASSGVESESAPPREEAPASRAPIDAASYAAPREAPAETAPEAETTPEQPAADPVRIVAEATPSPAPVRDPEPEPEVAVADKPTQPEAPVAPEPVAEPVAKTFESEFARFQSGALDNTAVVALIQQAVDENRLDALHDLLSFQPENDAERFAHRLYQAEYHVLSGRPLPALEILTHLGEQALTDEQKERVWFKTASCQRSMNDFAGADETLKRLMETFPDRSEYARLARRNYEQLVEHATDVPVLQKTTSLD